jgi:hypothetical protein
MVLFIPKGKRYLGQRKTVEILQAIKRDDKRCLMNYFIFAAAADELQRYLFVRNVI